MQSKNLTLLYKTTKHKKDSTILPQRQRREEKFIMGPIPLVWLIKAAQLPGKVLHVALILWYLTELENSKEVHMSSKTVNDFGVNRQVGYRALKALENAGLISVRRYKGRSPRVTILEGQE